MIVALACAGGPTALPVADPWGEARRALVAQPEHCFAGLAALCLDGPIVDEALQRVVDTTFHGRTPSTDAEVRRWVRIATSGWAAAQRDPARRAELEEQIRTSYASPAVTPVGTGIVADLGVVPGELVERRAGWTVGTSAVVADGEWTDAARALRDLRAAWPAADRIEVSIRVPSHGGLPRWKYRWVGGLDRILVVRPDDAGKVYATGPLGGDWGPDLPLGTHELLACPLAPGDLDLPGCPVPGDLR